MINIEDKEKRKTPILYKFFSEDNKIIQFIKHTSHRSHSSHRSHRSHRSHYSSSYITDNSTLKKNLIIIRIMIILKMQTKYMPMPIVI
jgi:hypothetical protein